MLKPLNDNVVVELKEAEKKTASGIILSGESGAPTHAEGIVMAVGPGKSLDNGLKAPLAVEVGQRVLFSNFGGTKIKHEGSELVILAESEILAIAE
ncbi:MAG: co-chaperone GroES [Turicibacter sp.]|nr:co-chaperone GroES [Turicibacter sp.]